MIRRSRTLAAILVLLVVGVTAVLAQVLSQAGSTVAGTSGGELSIDCNAKPPSIIDTGSGFERPPDPAPGVQSQCSHAPGSTFWVGVNVTAAPADGYFGFQSKLRWTEGVVNYIPVPEEDGAADSEDGPGEGLWADCAIAGRVINVPTDPSVLFACNPFPALTSGDTDLDQLLVFQLQCKTDFGASAPAGLDPNQASLGLVPRQGDNQGGTHFLDRVLGEIDPTFVGATVTCLGPQPPDSDADGCSDTQELGPDASLGGRRDPSNFWDFFDTPNADHVRDKAITAADLARVVARFGGSGDKTVDPLSAPGPASEYHPAFDRTPPGTAPNGIDQSANGSVSAQDIAVAVTQFGHTCASGGISTR